MKKNEGIVISHLSALAGVIQDKTTKEELFFFAEDSESKTVPRIGTKVTYERDGIDTATSVRVHLDIAS